MAEHRIADPVVSGSNPLVPFLNEKNGAKGESNPRPLAPEARIIPLDHWPSLILVANIAVTAPIV